MKRARQWINLVHTNTSGEPSQKTVMPLSDKGEATPPQHQSPPITTTDTQPTRPQEEEHTLAVGRNKTEKGEGTNAEEMENLLDEKPSEPRLDRDSVISISSE